MHSFLAASTVAVVMIACLMGGCASAVRRAPAPSTFKPPATLAQPRRVVHPTIVTLPYKRIPPSPASFPVRNETLALSHQQYLTEEDAQHRGAAFERLLRHLESAHKGEPVSEAEMFQYLGPPDFFDDPGPDCTARYVYFCRVPKPPDNLPLSKALAGVMFPKVLFALGSFTAPTSGADTVMEDLDYLIEVAPRPRGQRVLQGVLFIDAARTTGADFIR
jgi:hypothetical protein